MNKQCLECTNEFEITSKDLEFYSKVSPVIAGKKHEIPSPALCPSCRLQRRLAIRNERFLYLNKSVLSGKKVLTSISPDKDYQVITTDEWWGDSWDGLDYGVEYDFSKSFFKQFRELQKRVPRMPAVLWHAENCDYSAYIDSSKNCYRVFGSSKCEECYLESVY